MESNRVLRVLLVFISLLILASVLMTVWIHAKKAEKDVIKVKFSDGETEVVKVENLHLTPDGSCEYVIELKNDYLSTYNLILDFVDSAEGKTLKNYARVKIVSDGAVVYDELLATAFNNDGILLPVQFSTGKNEQLKIVYYLPLEVGNEAKNAEAVFEVLLTATNE